MAPQRVLDLKIERTHFNEGLGVVAARNDVTIVVAQHHDGRSGKIWPKNTFAAGIETVAVRERENRQGWIGGRS